MKKFGNQWHDIFNPVDSNSLNNQIYTESDRIVSLLRTGKTLKEDELDAIVSKINDHLDDGYFNDPSRMYNPDVVRKKIHPFLEYECNRFTLSGRSEGLKVYIY
ncbi:hypothetical protein H6769_02550 [Candidatus Peribacteria bacterium]|nr:hypothetical protein [Candidatus Peribacteria bacterium]